MPDAPLTIVARSVGPGTAVVIGGANVDVKARSAAAIVPATSNPGTTVTSAGGVGRNIAENLARLGSRVELVAAIGRDLLGAQLLDATRAAGVGVDHVVRTDVATGTYTAVLDRTGELVVAVADMAATAQLDAAALDHVRAVIAAASLVVLDANLDPSALCIALELAATASVPVVLDPVSVPKAHRVASVLAPERPVFCITPNEDELVALTGCEAGDPSAIDVLRRRGVTNVWVRRGAAGSVFHGPDGAATVLPAPMVEVRDVTGAGDAMAGAFAHALLIGRSVLDAARFAHAAAALTIESAHTVRPDLTEALVDAVLHDHARSHL